MWIVNLGMGGAFNPPGHAEHNWSVADEQGGAMSLSYALTQSWVPNWLKAEIMAKLEEHPGTLTEEWVKECYAYWKNCYSPDGTTREVCKLVRQGPPEWHGAHLNIVEYFPDYKPRTDLM